jgi:hypothetical protein
MGKLIVLLNFVDNSGINKTRQSDKYIFLRKFKSFSVELGSRAMKGWGLYLVTICKLFQRLVKENANYIDSIAPNLVFFFFLISEATLVTSFGAI